MRIAGFLLSVLVSTALGATVMVAGYRATREPQSGWVVAVGESFVVLDAEGAPAEVCMVEVGETYCHPVRRGSDLRRRPTERWRVTPDDDQSARSSIVKSASRMI